MRWPTQIIEALVAAKRPQLHVGGGVVLANAAEELLEFVDHMSLPVSHS
jgi:acetolactate synthase-1/2/3 large subunit